MKDVIFEEKTRGKTELLESIANPTALVDIA